MDEKIVLFLEHFPFIYTLFNMLLWIFGLSVVLNSENPHYIQGYIEKYFINYEAKHSFKRFLYPIFQTTMMYSIGMGLFLLSPFIFYHKGMVDACYFKLTLAGKFEEEFLFIYLIILLPTIVGLYYGVRIFVALIMDLFDLKDKHVEIKRSFYCFLVALSISVLIGIVLALVPL